MKLQIAAVALSATLVACGGGSGDSSDDPSIDDIPLIGGGDVGDTQLIDGIELPVIDITVIEPPLLFSGDSCVVNGDEDDAFSFNSSWDDNCVLNPNNDDAASRYAQSVQRIVGCQEFSNFTSLEEVNGFADGFIGPISADAIRNYQEVNGLAVDGVVGSETWGQLEDDIQRFAFGVSDLDVNDVYDVYEVPTIVCGGEPMFYQEREDGEVFGWLMRGFLNSIVPDAIRFSIEDPEET